VQQRKEIEHRPVVNWKTNLIVIWLSQFLSIMGFCFALPFTPYFIQQELGVQNPDDLNLWVAICSAATSCSLAIFSPIWGALGDRFGRRVMLIRANFAAAIIVALMGLVHTVEALALLRFLQGIFTGTVTAAQTMVAVGTPSNRSGLALGSLSSAVFCGGMAGSLLGGVVAEQVGFREAFYVGSALLFISGLLVLFGTTEQFTRGSSQARAGHAAAHAKLKGIIAPILILTIAVAFARQFDAPFVPLLVQDINITIDGASLWTGTLQALCGLAGLLSGIVIGPIADRISPARIAAIAALGAGLLMAPQAFATGFTALFLARFAMTFCAAALDPVLQIWLVKVTPAERRGSVFGWSATARSVGWMIASFASGGVALAQGIRPVFIAGAFLFYALVPLMAWVVWRVEKRTTAPRASRQKAPTVA
jgi:DHA1 family multidrug resistance protein-like MFS transporter